MNPLTLLALGSGASGLLSGLFGSGGDSKEMQANQMKQILMNFFRQMPQNYDQSINKYFNIAGQNLYGQEQRDVRSAGNRGAAQASAMNLSNPYSLMNRYVTDAYGQYAGQFGKLEEGRAQGLYQGQQDALKNRMALLQMMMANTGNYTPGFNFGRDMGPGLLSLGGQLGSALIQKG